MPYYSIQTMVIWLKNIRVVPISTRQSFNCAVKQALLTQMSSYYCVVQLFASFKNLQTEVFSLGVQKCLFFHKYTEYNTEYMFNKLLFIH